MAVSFHWADYLIFILVLVISAGIGIFFAWKDRNKQNAADFLLGGRKMGILPVSLSLMATLLSAVMVLGVPAEVYYNGAMYWVILFANFITYPIAAQAFLPVFHNLGLTSAYEYLEMRFNTFVRILGCVVFQIQMTLSMAMGLFAPAIALNQVMEIDMLVSILVIGAICTFYTAIGGLKAVMWTDTFQMVIILVGFIAVVAKGTEEVGGFNVIWDTARDAGRLKILDFNPSPLERHTFWTLIVGGSITTLTVYGGNQAMVQRYLSMESVTKAKIALYLQLPAGIIVTTLFVYGGLVLYAKYPVDPISDCTISLPDQLIPWLVMDVLGDYHGFPGLLLACIFSASLSTVSSGINAIALVCMADIIQPAYKHYKGREIGEPKATIISKFIAILSGASTIGLAFIAELFGDLILQVALSIYGMIGGPLLGLFVCAMFIPMGRSISGDASMTEALQWKKVETIAHGRNYVIGKTKHIYWAARYAQPNEWGAIIGIFVGLGMSSWLSVGTIVRMNQNRPPSPVCPVDNVSSNITSMMTSMSTATVTTMANQGPMVEESLSGLDAFYSLSYLWYSAFAVSVTVIVAVFVSCLTGGTRRKPVDEKLLSPLYHQISSFAKVTTKQFSKRYKTKEEDETSTHKSDLSIINGHLDMTSKPVHNIFTNQNFIYDEKPTDQHLGFHGEPTRL